jgi:hypothetical protein
MRMLSSDQILQSWHRHPRIEYQQMAERDEDLQRIRQSLPSLLAFGDATYFGVLTIVDWDHRLPSRLALLRVYAYYTERGLRTGQRQLEARTAEIRARDRFPEFDVPDYAGLSADEAYEADMGLDGSVERMRLISPWRREIGVHETKTSLRVTRDSEQFRNLEAETREKRADYLGDLEAVAWTPPCETSFERWTIDVWYLMHLDAAIGRGQSFLVDLEEQRVAGVREFVVRAG